MNTTSHLSEFPAAAPTIMRGPSTSTGPADHSPSGRLDPNAFAGCAAIRDAGLLGGLPIRRLEVGDECPLRTPLAVMLDGSGTVDVTVTTHERGCHHSLHVVEAGDFLVPVSSIGDADMHTFLHATEPCRVLMVDDGRYAQWLQVPAFAAAFAESMRWSVADTQMLLAIARNPRVDRRLLFTLYAAAERLAKATTSGLRFDLRLTHAQLGLLVGSARETVTKALRQLASTGELVIEHGTLTLPARGGSGADRPDPEVTGCSGDLTPEDDGH